MSNRIGDNYSVLIYGQSHAPSIGAVIEGLPAGFKPDWDAVGAFMARRAPGSNAMSTARKEADLPEILAGLNENGETCGAPLAMRIVNGDHRSTDYAKLKDVPRPGHADYPASVRYNSANDIRGGGQFSGRLTAPLCFAGALALQLLEKEGIRIRARVSRLAGIDDIEMDAADPQLDALCEGPLPVLDKSVAEKMTEAVAQAKSEGDSVGGLIECYAVGVPAGLGDPMFDGIENRLTRTFFGIPAVRGVEFGLGFKAADLRGSEHNDAYRMEDGTVRTVTNRHGGILGGITTGMPIIARIAIKPTPSIAKAQPSVSLSEKSNTELVISGRHDPCIIPRAVPCVEAAMAIALYDIILESRKESSQWT
ncbi:MAG: chorismate synthase [Clostridia bacterium]|nr:chorismate synthase [Clostridia bacterium]